MLSAFVTELLTLTFTVNASPSRVGISGRYPIILPIELSVHRLIIKLNQTYAQAFYRLRTSRTHPKIFAGLIAISLRVDDDRIDQLEDVLLAADVAERVVVHGFLEIDGVQRLDDIAALFEHLAALYQHRTLRVLSIRNKKKVSCF